jgi:hypothetical protein
LHYQALDDVVRTVNVLERAMTQSVSEYVILFFSQIAMCFVEEFERAMISASVSEVGIDWGMIIQILPVINGRVFDLGDRLIDFGDGMFFLAIHMAGVSLMCQVGARVAQVRECVQICRMSSRSFSERHGGTKCNAKCDYCAMSCDLHNLLR